MKKQSKITVWFRQIRGPFLVLSVALVLIGIAAAGRDGYNPRWFDAVLLITGVVLAHISVNLFNELSDYKTKIDEHTLPTPFSGGSGMMQAGLTNPKKVAGVAYTALIFAGFIGLYFCVTGSWVILVFIICGGVAVRFYTSHLARWLLGEFFSGLTLGTFVILGSYMALTGRLNIDILFISIPPGLLTFLLLFLNEFPDAEADRKGGRYHLVIHFGKKKSAIIYIAVLIVIYILILTSPFILNIPITVLVALLTLPIASAAAVKIVKFHSNTPKLVPALAMNVMVVILTDLLLAIGYFI
jgi:1,4-dihydroxy-2-naphthoate octaprenyltransferase